MLQFVWFINSECGTVIDRYLSVLQCFNSLSLTQFNKRVTFCTALQKLQHTLRHKEHILKLRPFISVLSLVFYFASNNAQSESNSNANSSEKFTLSWENLKKLKQQKSIQKYCGIRIFGTWQPTGPSKDIPLLSLSLSLSLSLCFSRGQKVASLCMFQLTEMENDNRKH